MKFLLMKGTIDLRKKNNSFGRLQKEIVKIEIQIDYGGVNQNTVETVKIGNIEICKRAYIFIRS